jgi:periplasmic protein TonB
MKRTVSLFEFMPYGAPELLAATRPHLALSLAAASLALLLAFCAALQIVPGLRGAVSHCDVRVDLTNVRFPAPPPLFVPRVPATAIAHASPHAAHATPVVLPDDIVLPTEPPPGSAGGFGEPSASGVSGAEPDAAESGTADAALPVRGVYVYVDELPVSIREVKPDYPELALDAGVEGFVLVHALVGKDGRVMRVELDEKFASPLLNQAALEAAKRWVFKPAFVNGHPVPVWSDIPFRFVLHE